MNRIFSNISIAAAGVLMLTACDNINDDDRYIEVDKVEAARVVLIEDFTGQDCKNCPNAHEVIEQLQAQYPKTVIAVSIHAGNTAISKESTNFDFDYIGLKTDDGDYYSKLWDIDSYPAGIINRRNGATEYDKWASLVREELARPTELNITMRSGETYGKISTEITLEPGENVTGKLFVWVIESGILAEQLSEQGSISDYIHKNVYRATLTGLNGKDVELLANIHQTFSFETDVVYNEHERWNPANLSIVAFVADENGVQQAAIVPVAPLDAK